MTSPSRVFAVLNLYTYERSVWHADEINEALGYTRATGYRYVKDLVDAGFLQKVSAGRYALGTRIFELDYLVRRSDPLLLAAVPVLEDLSRKARVDVVTSAMFGMKVVDTYRVGWNSALNLTYGRGRSRPLFRGGAPKLLVSSLARPQLVKVYQKHAAEISEAGLGDTWAAFRAHMTQLREQSFYLSCGEVEPGVGAAAVLVSDGEGQVVGALALVGSPDDLERLGERRMHTMLLSSATDIRDRLRQSV